MRIELKEPEIFTRFFQNRYGLRTGATISGVSIDSRKVWPGDLFIALRGERVDGHAFIFEALKSGAAAVLIEGKMDSDESMDRVVEVEDTLDELGQLAATWRQKFRPKVIAITGTNGKTTTKNLILEILSSRFKVSGTEGNYNGTIGLPLTLLRLHKYVEIVVVELGASQPGEVEYLTNIAKPDVAIITNIGRAHVEYFKSISGVAAEKSKLFELLSANGTAVFNLDDKYITRMKTRAERKTYSLENAADFRGVFESHENGDFISINEDIRIQQPIRGIHFAQNVLAATAVSRLMGITGREVERAVGRFVIPAGRGTVITRSGVVIIDDSYNANLDSAIAGIRALMKFPTSGRRIAILGDMLEMGTFSEEYHKQLGEFAATTGVDEVFCFGPESRATFCGALFSGMPAHHFCNKDELSYTLMRTVQPGDVVYIKGSRGMEMETILHSAFMN